MIGHVDEEVMVFNFKFPADVTEAKKTPASATSETAVS
jgi:hypothetical protein